MEITTQNKKIYQLKNVKAPQSLASLSYGRYLVGRAESCDVVVSSKVVSAVHAVLEIGKNSIKVYDMNSRNGTFVNGNQVIAKEIVEGDEIRFGNISFSFSEYRKAPDLPPILETLEPQKGKSSVVMNTPSVVTEDELPSMPEKNRAMQEPEVPYIVYPLGADPKADYSEYIFEDVEYLYPIFKYEHSRLAIEVMILHKDNVYSVDYLPEKNNSYKIAGVDRGKNSIEFPYMGIKEEVPFVEVKSGNCIVSKLHNFKAFHLINDSVVEVSDDTLNLQGNDIVKLVNGDLEIYIRKVSSPPKVKTAPFFRRDKKLKKYIFLVLLFMLLPFAALNFYQVDKEKEKEKAPERIATILYKRPLKVSKEKAVEKTKEAPKKVQKAPPKKVVKKQPPKPKKVVKPKAVKTPKKVTKSPGVKKAPVKQVVKKVAKPLPKRSAKPRKTFKSAAAKPSSRKKFRSTRPRRSVRVAKSRGAVDVFKSFNFKSTVSKTMSKGGQLRGSSAAVSARSNSLSNVSVGGGVASNLRKADASAKIGSLTGAARGKLAQSKGTEGLAAKTSGAYTVGIPSEGVVLGSMNPDDVLRILRQHIPQFRYCYQKELDKNPSKGASGVVKLMFTIGASGHVTKAGVGSNRLPSHVKRCVARVLRGIQFPSPKGGGTVDVKQPINFYPEKI